MIQYTIYNNNNHLNIFSSYSFLGLFFFLGIFLIESYPYAPDLLFSNIIKLLNYLKIIITWKKMYFIRNIFYLSPNICWYSNFISKCLTLSLLSVYLSFFLLFINHFRNKTWICCFASIKEPFSINSLRTSKIINK